MTGAERGKIRAVPREVFSKTPSLSLRLRVGPTRGAAPLFGPRSAVCSVGVRFSFGSRWVWKSVPVNRPNGDGTAR